MVDKNLFLHDLAVVAILKCEGPYLKDWLDYHLLAGVNHFYLYDNESPDNQAEVAKPYVEAGLVDYFPAPGKMMQMAVYNEAVKRFKFHCRYMAFIDGDEFVYPKLTAEGTIVDVVDKILPRDPKAAGLVMNWQTFGSNGREKADYSRGVLERFTRRCNNEKGMNTLFKSIADPRRINFISGSLSPNYFEDCHKINENGDVVVEMRNKPVTAEKIVVNHYHYMSREEYAKRAVRGEADHMDGSKYAQKYGGHEYNEIFDDGILKYRAARAEKFSLESDEHRLNRVIDSLIETLSKFNSGESAADMETALTCRALSTYLREHLADDADCWKICEQTSLKAILSLSKNFTFIEARLFLSELLNLLRLPYPEIKDIRRVALQLIPQMMSVFRLNNRWKEYVEMDNLQEFLK